MKTTLTPEKIKTIVSIPKLQDISISLTRNRENLIESQRNLKREISKLRADLETSESSVQDLKSRMAELENENERLSELNQQRLRMSSRNSERKQGIILQLRNPIEDIESAPGTAEEQAQEELEREIKRRDDIIEELQSQLEQERQECKETIESERMAAVKLVVQQADAETKAKMKKVRFFDEKVVEAEKRLEQLQNEIFDAEFEKDDDIQAKKKELDGVMARVQEMEEKLEAEKAKNAAAVEEVAKLVEEKMERISDLEIQINAEKTKHEVEITTKESEISQAEAQIGRLENEIKEMQGSLKVMDGQWATLREKNEEERKRLEEQAKATRREQRIQLKNMNKQIEALKKEVVVTRQKIAEANKSLEDSHAALAKAEADIGTCVDQAKQELEDVIKQRDEVMVKVEEKEREKELLIKDTKDEIKKVEKEIEEKMETLSTLTNEMETVKFDFDKKMLNATATKEEKDMAIERLKTDISEMKKQISVLTATKKTEGGTFDLELDELQSKKMHLAHLIEDLTKERQKQRKIQEEKVAEIKHEIETAERTKASLVNRFEKEEAELNKEIGELRDKLAAVTEANDKLDQDATARTDSKQSELDDINNQLEARIQIHEKHIGAMKKKYEDLEKKIEQAHADMENQKQKYEKQQQALTNEIQDKELTLVFLKKDYSTTVEKQEAAVETFKESIKASDTAIEDLRKQKEEVEAKTRSLLSEMMESKQERDSAINALEKDKAQKEGDLQKLVQQMEAAEGEFHEKIESLKSSLDATTSKIDEMTNSIETRKKENEAEINNLVNRKIEADRTLTELSSMFDSFMEEVEDPRKQQLEADIAATDEKIQQFKEFEKAKDHFVNEKRELQRMLSEEMETAQNLREEVSNLKSELESARSHSSSEFIAKPKIGADEDMKSAETFKQMLEVERKKVEELTDLFARIPESNNEDIKRLQMKIEAYEQSHRLFAVRLKREKAQIAAKLMESKSLSPRSNASDSLDEFIEDQSKDRSSNLFDSPRTPSILRTNLEGISLLDEPKQVPSSCDSKSKIMALPTTDLVETTLDLDELLGLDGDTSPRQSQSVSPITISPSRVPNESSSELETQKWDDLFASPRTSAVGKGSPRRVSSLIIDLKGISGKNKKGHKNRSALKPRKTETQLKDDLLGLKDQINTALQELEKETDVKRGMTKLMNEVKRNMQTYQSEHKDFFDDEKSEIQTLITQMPQPVKARVILAEIETLDKLGKDLNLEDAVSGLVKALAAMIKQAANGNDAILEQWNVDQAEGFAKIEAMKSQLEKDKQYHEEREREHTRKMEKVASLEKEVTEKQQVLQKELRALEGSMIQKQQELVKLENGAALQEDLSRQIALVRQKLNDVPVQIPSLKQEQSPAPEQITEQRQSQVQQETPAESVTQLELPKESHTEVRHPPVQPEVSSQSQLPAETPNSAQSDAPKEPKDDSTKQQETPVEAPVQVTEAQSPVSTPVQTEPEEQKDVEAEAPAQAEPEKEKEVEAQPPPEPVPPAPVPTPEVVQTRDDTTSDDQEPAAPAPTPEETPVVAPQSESEDVVDEEGLPSLSGSSESSESSDSENDQTSEQEDQQSTASEAESSSNRSSESSSEETDETGSDSGTNSSSAASSSESESE